MVDGADRHRGVEGLVRERKLARGGGHAGRCTGRALRPHDFRRLDGGDVAVGWFIRAGARPDVHDGLRVAKRRTDLGGDARIGAPGGRVGAADAVVELLVGDVLIPSAPVLTNVSSRYINTLYDDRDS